MNTIANYDILSVLYALTETVIYRAKKQDEENTVLIKTLEKPYPTPSEVARLRREYDIAVGLGLPGIVRPLALEKHQNGLAIVLEDFGGESLHAYAKAHGFEIGDFLLVAIRLADTLGQIHQRRVVHKDIKPHNIIIQPESKVVKLTDFGIASLLSRENQQLQNPDLLEGTLAYMSPEQTGRMNRAIDYRTDFYSLGVTFYEMLAGQLPFTAQDPMALVHCHMAHQAEPLEQVNPQVPPMLAAIIAKLMAKTAEARYQSAYGLKHDLEQCWQSWQVLRRIEPFPLGEKDVALELQISQKLYGRQAQVTALMEAFERVSRGATEMMLVSGYSGIGKSSLIAEIHKPLVAQGGFFIAGKFDQYQRNVPYASLIAAFRELVRQLLTESEEGVAAWRAKILLALGGNGAVVTAVIPEVALLIGEQPPVAALPAVEAQNRFNLTFKQFVRVFATAQHPLVIFLDDLQWADAASLKLISLLLTDLEMVYLLFVGAYRSNEVSPAHPLMLTLDDLRQQETVIQEISLLPLQATHLNELIGDSLGLSVEQVRPLAELVWRKTDGNPFFVNEFLKTLVAEKVLRLKTDRWSWDLPRLEKLGITHNVVELMAGKIQKLPMVTQTVLRLAACIGSRFDLHTLAIVYEEGLAETAAALWTAVEEGLVLPIGHKYKYVSETETQVTYKFVHDRVQQAAYSLIPDEAKQSVHATIGWHLWRKTDSAELDSRLFDIVNHLNIGVALMTEPATREQLARLNLEACQKAKAATAYEAAWQYAHIGLGLLTDSYWQTNYDLMFALSLEHSENAFLTGRLEIAQEEAERILAQARDTLDKVKVRHLQVIQWTTIGKLPEALACGLEGLKLVGIDLTGEGLEAQVAQEIEHAFALLGDRPIHSLIDLPPITDPTLQATLTLLASLSPATYFLSPNVLFGLTVMKVVNISLGFGTTVNSSYGFVTYGIILCGVLNAFKDGYAFGRLALDLAEKLNYLKNKPQVYMNFGGLINHWQAPAEEGKAFLKQSIQYGLACGDFIHASYAGQCIVIIDTMNGTPLEETVQDAEKYMEFVRLTKDPDGKNFLMTVQQAVLCLQGKTFSPTSLSTREFDERKHVLDMKASILPAVLHRYYIMKMQLLFLFEEYAAALAMVEESAKILATSLATLYVPEHYFYDSLIRAALYVEAGSTVQTVYWGQMTDNLAKMKTWADACPANYAHKYYLMAAEMSRLEGRIQEAMAWYDQAIESALMEEYTQNAAIANELAGQFYLGNGRHKIARMYLREARYAYQKWGATRKVEFLDEKYPYLNMKSEDKGSLSLTFTNTGTTSSVDSQLDLATVMKASQAISGEIHLDKLLTKLIIIAIENAGAERGLLILENDGTLLIEAEGSVRQPDVWVRQSVPVRGNETLSAGIVNYVLRTQQPLVLHHAAQEGVFVHDPYVVKNDTKSVLCMPLLNQGRLVGMLYLENNLATHVFTSNRLEILRLLSSQATISLENARLFEHQVKLTQAYGRFVPQEFLRFLHKKSIIDVALGDQVKKEMSVMFADVRSFTSLSEKMTPKETFDFINRLLGTIGPLIRQHNGFIDKYMGDGIMALFPETADDAVQAALGMQKQMVVLNAEREGAGATAVHIGIGIHTGDLMLGTIGDAERMEGTVIADAVNTASRLEGVTKIYEVGIVISQATYQRLANPGRYQTRPLGQVFVKGKEEAVPVLAVEAELT